MPAIVKDLSPSPLLEAMEANIQEAWIHLSHGLGAEVHNEPELLWFYSAIPFQLANGIVRAHFPSDTVEETLEKLLKQLTAQHIPMAWLIGPSTRPTDLGSRLEQHGWIHDDDAPGMAIDLHTLDEHFPIPSQLSIKRVSDGEALKTWLRIMTVGSEIPEEGLTLLLDVVSKHTFNYDPNSVVHYYLGMLGDRPVATSLLYLAGGVAGIYNVATLPGVRRQGYGSALTVAPSAGCTRTGLSDWHTAIIGNGLQPLSSPGISAILHISRLFLARTGLTPTRGVTTCSGPPCADTGRFFCNGQSPALSF